MSISLPAPPLSVLFKELPMMVLAVALPTPDKTPIYESKIRVSMLAERV